MSMKERALNAAWAVDRSMTAERYAAPQSRRERYDDWRIKLESAKLDAILQALREPSEGMIDAGAPVCEWESFGVGTDGKAEARVSFTAMIDVIINEGK